MEILNKNQRDSALWRLAALGFIVLGLNAFILFSSYKAFAIKDGGELERLRKQLKTCQYEADGMRHQLQNKINDLEDRMKNAKSEKNNLKSEKNNTEKTIADLKEQNKSLKDDLQLCRMAQLSSGK